MIENITAHDNGPELIDNPGSFILGNKQITG